MKAKGKTPREIVKPGRARQPAAPLTYREWLKKAGAPTMASATMRPRDWRNLYIAGATPEQAAEAAGVNLYNAKSAPALRAKRR